MIQIDLPPLVKRLNLFSRQALEMAERKARAPAAERDYSDTRFTRSAYRRQTPPRASVTDAAQPLAGYTPASSLPVTGLRGTHPA